MTVIVHNNEINKASIQELYAGKLQSIFEKFARSITSHSTPVKLVQQNLYGGEPPAWSSDSSITVVHNIAKGSIIAADSIVRLKGLLIHELSHLLFTPRSKTDFIRKVLGIGLSNALNILEDNRIENLMLGKLSGVKPWLIHTVAQELLQDIPADQLLPLVWGRKYLPKEIRTTAFDQWYKNKKDPGHAQRVADVIDQYLPLTLTSKVEQDTGLQLVRALHELIKPESDGEDAGKQVQSTNHRVMSCSPESDGSKPSTKSQQNKLFDQSPAKQPENTDTSNGDSDDDDNDATNDNVKTETTVKDLLRQAMANAQSDIIDDVKSTIQSVRESDDISVNAGQDTMSMKDAASVKKVTYKSTQVPKPTSVTAARKFAAELTELRALHDPGWIRKTSQGRVNVHQFLLDADFDELFDSWSDGNQDVTDIECVIMLDKSGSMSNALDDAYNAMWSIKRALDSINASTTVIQFAQTNGILYSANERAGNQIVTAKYANGGDTRPFYGLTHAKDILNNSSRAIKMLLIITDGEWADSHQCDQLIMNMRMNGVLTGLVFLHDPAFYSYRMKDSEGNTKIDGHKCEVVTAIDKPLDIVQTAKSLTAIAQRKAMSY